MKHTIMDATQIMDVTYHFVENPWKNFYKELTIKPTDPPNAPGVISNPFYQIISISITIGEVHVGRSFITKFRALHSNPGHDRKI